MYIALSLFMLHAVQSIGLGALGIFPPPDFKPRFGYKNFFSARPYFCSFFPSSLLFCLPLSFSLLHSTTTNERTNELANERTVTLTFSSHVNLLVTIINFLSFASFLLLLTLDRLQR
jgi:hypothetical protein